MNQVVRPRTDSEKITLNLGFVDLGQIDLLVKDGFYANRTDLIRRRLSRTCPRNDRLDCRSRRSACERRREIRPGGTHAVTLQRNVARRSGRTSSARQINSVEEDSPR